MKVELLQVSIIRNSDSLQLNLCLSSILRERGLKDMKEETVKKELQKLKVRTIRKAVN